MELSQIHDHYYVGWGENGANAKPVLYNWTFVVNDIMSVPTSFSFDLVQEKSPLIIGLDQKKYSDTMNQQQPTTIVLNRPQDIKQKTFFTYLQHDDHGNARLRLELVPHKRTTRKLLLAIKGRNVELNAIKKLHRFTHASASEMNQLLEDANVSDHATMELCRKVFKACDVCAQTGRPSAKKKISISHVNEAFNQSIEADFLVAYIKGEKYIILNIICMGTNYGERVIVKNRSAGIMVSALESEWLYHHGAPRYFASDPEFCNTQMNSFLSAHQVELQCRPSRSSHKNGKVERNNGIFKNILERLSKEKTVANEHLLVKRASFLTNMFHGSSLVSSFQLARGYSPSLLCIPAKIVPVMLIEAYKQTSAARALNKVLRAHNFSTLSENSIDANTDVWIFYKSSKQNEKNEWVKGKVISASKHFAMCKRSEKGVPMKVAYEDLRIVPKGDLAQELQSSVLEDYISTDNLHGKCSTKNSDRDQKSSEMRSPLSTPTFDDKALNMYLNIDDENESDELPKLHSSLLSENYHLDIGNIVVDKIHNDKTSQLQSSEHEELQKLYKILGNKAVSRNHIETAPNWLIAKAVQNEIEDAWKGAFEEVDESTIPKNGNIISSHIIYKVKQNEDGTLKLKARLCPHRNRDRAKGTIRSDSANVQFDIFRLLLSLATMLDFRLGCVDVTAAYLQSGPISRELFVRPPREYQTKRGVVWKLIKLSYGISEAGRQWAKTIESWLLHDQKMVRVNGISQLYLKRDQSTNITLLLAKLTDDLLIAGSEQDMHNFATSIQKRFKIGKVVINANILFNGCEISQNEFGNVELSMTKYLESIKPVMLQTDLYRDESKATEAEIHDFRRLAGELVWLGSGALPQASYFGSVYQQRVPILTRDHVLEANRTLKQLKKLIPKLLYTKPAPEIDRIELVSFSDASFNISRRQVYGQSGVTCGIRYRQKTGDARIFHIVDWTSHKQKRVCYSAYGAEILACTAADDRGLALKQGIMDIFPATSCIHHIRTDSKALFDTITTLHECREYRLRQTVQQIRDSFESRELNEIRWIQSHANIADALTKHNPEMHRLLNRVATSGTLVLPNHLSQELDSTTWT